MFKHGRHILILVVAAAVASLMVIGGRAQTGGPARIGAGTNRMVFAVKGVVKGLEADGKTVVIQHEAVLNYMPAMTMPFEVRDTNELRGLQTGDAIGFQMIVAGDTAWIERVTKLKVTGVVAQQPSRADFRVVREVDFLKVGDALPKYHFTNQFGKAVSTKQFLGQALVFTFFFTRCPYPNFCPLMSRNFEQTQKKLLAMTNGPANWQLISISFDTEYDAPEDLKDYGTLYQYDPAHWSFVTGDLTEITAIGDQVGEYFGHDESGGITHNLRTVVVDARGRVQRILGENKWTSDELTAEVVKAAAVKE